MSINGGASLVAASIVLGILGVLTYHLAIAPLLLLLAFVLFVIGLVQLARTEEHLHPPGSVHAAVPPQPPHWGPSYASPYAPPYFPAPQYMPARPFPPPPPPTAAPGFPPPPPGRVAERFCPSCGSSNLKESAFCHRCGHPLPPTL